MKDDFDALARVVRGRTDVMLDYIAELVDVNSYTANKDGGDLVGTILNRHAKDLGLSFFRTRSEKYADHLVIATPAAERSSEGAIALVGHVDTVFPPGTFEGFRREDGIARGPGVLDMKGGIVVMLEAIRAVREVGGLDRLKVRMVLVGDEEIGSPEGRPFIVEQTKAARCALVFEAGRAHDKIITRRKGTGSAKVVAIGKAAHAANNHKDGVNAIWAMAKFIDRAQQLTEYDRGITVNVGVVGGGEAKNTVPDRCECQLDFRFEKIDDAHATYAELTRACGEAEREIAGARFEISGGPARMPLERTEQSAALFRAYAEHARAVGLGSDEAPLIAGGSDASTTSAAGIPSIDGLGPRGSGFHTKEELIEIASLEPKVLALARFLWESSATP